MKQKAGILALLLISAILSVACGKTPSTSAPSSTPATTGSEEPSPTASLTGTETMTTATSGSTTGGTTASTAPTKPGLPDLSSAGTGISAEELGLDVISGSYFYWSPDSSSLVFIGYKKDDQDKYTKNVYLLRLDDRQLDKISPSIYDSTEFMIEPQWSADSSILTVPFYDLESEDYPIVLYDITRHKIVTLPVEGNSPSISPDRSMVAYSDLDGRLRLYSLSQNAGVEIPGNPEGFHPIWFSDSTRLLFAKPNGDTQDDMQHGKPGDICLLDINHPESAQVLSYGRPYSGLKWLVPDELVWLDYGFDDGFHAQVVDLLSLSSSDIAESAMVTCQIRKGYLRFICDSDEGAILCDREMKRLGAFFIKEGGQEVYASPISLLSGTLILFSEFDYDTMTGLLKTAPLDAHETTDIIVMDGLNYSFPSPDGSSIAFVSDAGDSLRIVSAQDFAGK